MEIDADFWAGKKVFLTGHTGFKGGWLALWLSELGAKVTGYALAPPSEPSLYDQANIANCLEADIRGDIRNRELLSEAMTSASPEIVFHLAAQALVPESYAAPIETYETNVIGTANVLMAAFDCPSAPAIVSVASDKCYENREWVHPYREADRLGGKDPYSSSKACAEILTASFRDSFQPKSRLATARAGNVIGGGDWASSRLVPDCVRAFSAGKPVVLRRPGSVRPWQWVMEPLSGYLLLAEKLARADDRRFEGGWNFGPVSGREATVLAVAEALASRWGDGARLESDPSSSTLTEANLLRLDCTKAQVELGWRPTLQMDECINWTADWYMAWGRGEDLERVTKKQVADFMELVS